MLKKVLLLTLAASLSLFAATNKEIEEYKTSLFKNAKQAVIKSVKVVSRESMEGYNGWESVILLVEFTIDRAGTKQTIKAPDMVFVKGDFLADDIVNLKKGKTLKDSFKPKPGNEYYDSEHLVAGNKDAKNKILIFSDPLCPFCRDIVPDVIAAAVKHPNAMAVYHYSFPLVTIHPASESIIKAEISQRGKIKNKADFLTKLYKTDVEALEMNEEKIAAKLSSELGIKITKMDMEKKETVKEYDEELQKAYQILVRGTPTIIINGELDSTKAKINQLLKEYK
jgi:protein-disulfide isomerase